MTQIIVTENWGPPCEACGRREGYAPLDRHGCTDMNPDTPLGKVEKCRYCKRLACPDCLHERDCCAVDEEDYQ